jgi:Ni/Fe-hydrogenase subunit HybB-like protein
VSVHSVLSWAFALVSRPGWHESIWAPYFVIAALYSGVALAILVIAGFRKGYRLEAHIHTQHFVRLGYIMVALGAIYAYLTFADMLPSAYVGEKGPVAIIYGMLMGKVALEFWFFLVTGTIIRHFLPLHLGLDSHDPCGRGRGSPSSHAALPHLSVAGH